MDWDRVPGVLFSIPFGLNSQTPLIFIHSFLVHATCCRPARARYAVAELDMKNGLCYAEDRKRKDYYDSLEQMD